MKQIILKDRLMQSDIYWCSELKTNIMSLKLRIINVLILFDAANNVCHRHHITSHSIAFPPYSTSYWFEAISAIILIR